MYESKKDSKNQLGESRRKLHIHIFVPRGRLFLYIYSSASMFTPKTSRLNLDMNTKGETRPFKGDTKNSILIEIKRPMRWVH